MRIHWKESARFHVNANFTQERTKVRPLRCTLVAFEKGLQTTLRTLFIIFKYVLSHYFMKHLFKIINSFRWKHSTLRTRIDSSSMVEPGRWPRWKSSILKPRRLAATFVLGSQFNIHIFPFFCFSCRLSLYYLSHPFGRRTRSLLFLSSLVPGAVEWIQELDVELSCLRHTIYLLSSSIYGKMLDLRFRKKLQLRRMLPKFSSRIAWRSENEI